MLKNSSPPARAAFRYAAAILFSLITALLFSTAVHGQPTPALSAPFKKCFSYGTGNGLTKIVASDNESSVIVSTDDLTLIHKDTISLIENWRTPSAGKIVSNAVTDKENFYFITAFEGSDNKKSYRINSNSLKTGITTWQTGLTEYTGLPLVRSRDGQLLFIITGAYTIRAYSAVNGGEVWAKKYIDPVISLESTGDNSLNVLFQNRLLKISAAKGETESDVSIGSEKVSNLLYRDGFFFLGYPNGEFRKTSVSSKGTELIWKLKTGGGISGLYEFKKKLLVTSLDNFVYLVSFDSGKIRWKKRAGGRINIMPLFAQDFALVISSGDNSSVVFDLTAGKIVNQINLEEDNYFLGQPVLSGRYLIVPTFRGLYFFVNTSVECQSKREA